jgi:CMP-N-acetylneuraminic acid synthetase
MNILCTIPSRGRSKGVPGKNLRNVGGKPLIAWSIRHALDSQTPLRVIVSTDSEEIAEVAREHGAEMPFLRPAELATDAAPTEPRRQDMTNAMVPLRETGSLYVTPTAIDDDLVNRIGGKVSLFVMDESEGLDTEIDILVADRLLDQLGNHG